MKTIRAHEAHNDNNAIETVINGKRNIGTIGLIHNSLTGNFWDIIKTNNLKVLKIPSNPQEVYIYFRPGSETQAQELKDIAEKYNGYFAYWATENDTRRIGQLLSYHQNDIEDFIKRNKKNDRQKRTRYRSFPIIKNII
jgi:hypothetical protein